PRLARLASGDGRHRHARDAAAASPQLDEHLRFDFVAARRQRKMPKRVRAEHAEPALRIVQRQADEPRQDAAAHAVGVIARSRHAASLAYPLPHDEIGPGARGRPEQHPRFLRQMLHVAVQNQNVSELAQEHRRKTGPDRLSFSAVRIVTEKMCACGARDFSGAVCRPIIHYDHGIHQVADAPDHVRNRAGLVERRDQGSRPDGHARWSSMISAGRTSTDAAASATTLTAETTPIDRSGGYDEYTSVP